MADPVKKFEVLILKPMQLVLTAAAIFFIVKTMWLWLAACVLGLFYLGIIGSKLHPLQSAADLAKGPLTGPAADIESALLRMDEKRRLVGQACTRVGILVGVSAGILLIAILEWPWYMALVGGWGAIVVVGALLSIAFKSL